MAEQVGSESLRTYEEINAKIRRRDAVVPTADEFVAYAAQNGLEATAKEVDVVTTGTFGAMCSSGAFLNFGHSEPPLKMSTCWLNDVPAYKGLAAVGAGMKGAPGIAARVFRAVADRGVNVRMIVQGSSELNISFVVRQDDMLKSAQALHEEFQLDRKGTH